MKTAVIFHSVCGNCYFIAQFFAEALKKYFSESEIYRVSDPDHQEIISLFPPAGDYFSEIQMIETVKPENMLNADLILMGCPTYFGNVSAEMKTFMDSTSGFYLENRLAGKFLVPFTSSASIYGGGELTLNALRQYGTHMGMNLLSVPSNLYPKLELSAYGFIHVSGSDSSNRPGDDMKQAIDIYVKQVLCALNIS